MPEPNAALDVEAVREHLPAAQNQAYLNSGSAGPLCQAAAHTMGAFVQRQFQEGRSNMKVIMETLLPALVRLRSAYGRLLGAAPEEMAITQNTTEGMNIAVWGINWQPGDEIVTTDLEHEGGALPVYAVARRHSLALRVVPLCDHPGETAERILAALSPRTRLVALSHVSYLTGEVLPVGEIVAAAHRVGARVLVDGAQAVGAIPVDVRDLGVDFYAFPGQKWLCGPDGTGGLYVRGDRLGELDPTFVGFFTLREPGDWGPHGYFQPAPTARRYEVSTFAWPAILGMEATLRWLEQVGHPGVHRRVRQLTGFCRDRLAALPGAHIHTPSPYAGLTAFSVEGLDPQPTCLALADEGVVIRWLPNRPWMRVSTAFFNIEADIERLVTGLRRG